MAALLSTVVAFAGLIIVVSSVGADSLGFVLTATLLSFGLAPFAGDSLQQHIPHSLWERLSLSHTASRRLALPTFNTLLNHIGWNRLIIALRDGQSSASIQNRRSKNLRPVQAAAAGHTWGFLLHIATAAWAGIAGAWGSATVLIVTGIIGHLYPALLQIRVLTRWREHGRS